MLAKCISNFGWILRRRGEGRQASSAKYGRIKQLSPLIFVSCPPTPLVVWADETRETLSGGFSSKWLHGFKLGRMIPDRGFASAGGGGLNLNFLMLNQFWSKDPSFFPMWKSDHTSQIFCENCPFGFLSLRGEGLFLLLPYLLIFLSFSKVDVPTELEDGTGLLLDATTVAALQRETKQEQTLFKDLRR